MKVMSLCSLNLKCNKKIKTHKTSLSIYTERLVKDGLIPEGEIEDMKAAFQMRLNEEFEAGKVYKPNKADWLDGRWKHLQSKDPEYQRGKTAITKNVLMKLDQHLLAYQKVGIHIEQFREF